MTLTALASTDTSTSSPTLWRTWFDAGLNAIDREDFLRAVEWLCEALCHVGQGGADDCHYAVTQANLAYALFRLAQGYCWRAEDPCTGEAERKEAEKLAADKWNESKEHADRSLAKLPPKFDRSIPKATLATARAAHAAAEVAAKSNDQKLARERFELALSYYQYLPGETAATIEVAARLFQAHCELEEYGKAIDVLSELEKRAKNFTLQETETGQEVERRRRQQEWLAIILACRAEVNLRRGEYQRAAALYLRWRRLVARCVDGQAADQDCVFGLSVFGRAFVFIGKFPDAGRLLLQAEPLVECLPEAEYVSPRTRLFCRCQPVYLCAPPDQLKPLIRFDIALALGDLARRQGDLACARARLECAASLCPPWFDRQAQLCLATGQLELACGNYRAALDCFCRAKELSETHCKCRLNLFVPAVLGVARIESLQSNWQAALSCANEALCALERANTVCPEMAWTLHEFAVAYNQDDKPEESDPLCRRAIQLLGMTLRPDHPDEAEMELTLAESLLSQHKPADAETACHRACKLLRENAPCDGFNFARVLRIEGEIAQARREIACAQWHFDCALKYWQEQESETGCDQPEEALIWIGLAVTNVSNGHSELADEIYPEICRRLLAMKGGNAGAGFELNRRGNLFMSHALYFEAAWLYKHAYELYCVEYGPRHECTCQVEQNYQKADFACKCSDPNRTCECARVHDQCCPEAAAAAQRSTH